MTMCWQYHLDDGVDGKAPGWYNFDIEACSRLDDLWEQKSSFSEEPKPVVLKSGFFTYDINFSLMTQRNVTSGTVRNIRRTPPRKKQKTNPKFENVPQLNPREESGTGQEAADDVKETPDGQPDVLSLTSLFDDGHGYAWLGPLSAVLESLPDAERFIGSERSKSIKPVRELTFQALKPHLPVDWRVVVFGQNPYPRLESATGIAMFDGALDSWQSSAFGKTVSMRCIIKAAAMATHGIPEKTSVSALRKHLADNNIISPTQWFQAMLSQGILLLNAALTVGGDDEVGEKPLNASSTHAKFWRPVIESILDTILKAKASLPQDDERKGIIFLHWGVQALKTKKAMKKVLDKYASSVYIRHVQHCNPAAQGDLFCRAPSHFQEVNDILRNMGHSEINWLPDEQWLQKQGGSSTQHAEFISKTQQLHKLYLERLQSGLDSVAILKPISGVLKMPLVSIGDACDPLNLKEEADWAFSVASNLVDDYGLSQDEAASILVYTGDSLFEKLNAALRDPGRGSIEIYFSYLRLLITAHDNLPCQPTTVYRGISRDLSSIYKEGSEIVWYSVSSCTSNKFIAKSFAGSHGTLFCIKAKTAKEIQKFSYFADEEELVLAPGTKLKVVKVKRSASGRSTIKLREVVGERLVF